MKRKSIIALALLLSMLLQCMPVTVWANETAPVVQDNGDSWVIVQDNYTINIIKDGFCYGFTKPDGTVMADAHGTSGVSFSVSEAVEPSPVVSSTYEGFEDDTAIFEVTNADGGKATVTMQLFDNYVKLDVAPLSAGTPAATDANDTNYMVVGKGSGTVGLKKLNVDVTDNYTYEADVRLSSSGESTESKYKDSLGLVAHYVSDADYHLFFFNSDGAYVKRFRSGESTATVGQNTDIKFELGTWYHLKMVVNGQDIQCYVDDQLVIHATDSIVDPATFVGGCGVRTYLRDSHLDNVKVTDNATGEVKYDQDFEDATLDDVSADWETITGSNTPCMYDSEKGIICPGFVVDARVGGLPHTYGLGDIGDRSNTGNNAIRDSANLLGVNKDGNLTAGKARRFVSGFVIAPDRDFAMCIFETEDKRYRLLEDESAMGCRYITEGGDLTVYYFFGETEQIYSDYKDVRWAEGYYDSEPHYEMYGIGWESWGALGWNVSQESVTKTVQNYLDHGTKLTWTCIGSGFWAGDRAGEEGLTTSFGMWDDTASEGVRNDAAKYGLPNPRYPDVEGMKEYFAENNLALILGLRTNFQLPEEYNGVTYGGGLVPEVDGDFVFEALDNGYLHNDPRTGELVTFSGGDIQIPNGSNKNDLCALLDSGNEDAVAWYAEQVDLWDVDGFKEDTMIYKSQHNEGNFNNAMYVLTKGDNDGTDAERDYLMIIRNSAYSVPGDILRANDFNYDMDDNRMPLNLGAFAASGQGNVYPDILGGLFSEGKDKSTSESNDYTEDFELWVTREAWLAALSPSMSVSGEYFTFENKDYVAAIDKALTFHSTYAPTFYSAALKNYETGYPYAHTPIYIAYPDDTISHELYNTTDQTWEWLVDETLLAAPIFGNDYATMTSRDIYLPEGQWMDYDTGKIYEGPMVLEDYELPLGKTPAFVGGKGILVGEELSKDTQTALAEDCNYFVEVFPVAQEGTVYDYTWVDGNTKSTITANMVGFNHDTLVVTDTTDDEVVEYTIDETTKAIRFAYEAGHDYEVTGGWSDVMESVEVTCEDVQVGETVEPQVTVMKQDGNEVTDLTGYDVKFEVRNVNVISEDLVALRAGETAIRAVVTKDDLTVKSEWTTVKVLSAGVGVTSPAYGAELTTGSFTVTGTATGVASVEAVLSKDGSDVDTQTLTPENGAFSISYEEVADGDYTLTLTGKNGESTVCTKIFQFSVDTAEKVVYENWDTLAADGSKWHYDTTKTAWTVTDGILTSGSAVLYTEDTFSGSYTIEADVTLADKANNTAGLIFGATDASNFYHVRIKMTGAYEFYHVVNGTFTKIDAASGTLDFTVEANKKYALKVEVDGSKVAFYVDSVLIKEHTFDEAIPEGAVGYRAYGSTFTSDAFDIIQYGLVKTSYVDTEGNELAESVSLKKIVGDTYVTEEKAFYGYELSAAPSNASGTVTNGTTEVVYTYEKAAGMETGTVTAHYQDVNGNELAESVQLTGEVGELYELEKEIEGYSLTAAEGGESTGRFSTTPAEVTLIYANDAAAEIVTRIDEIGIITLDSGEVLAEIREAYDALTDMAKQEVTNYQSLLNAENEYAVLVSGENADAAEAAKEAAEAAQKAAEEAQSKAEQAEADAVTAQEAAEKAKTDAENAKIAAEEARTKAEEAENAAKEAAENAGEDAEAAETAKAAAETAKALAQTAQGKAEQAEADAVIAQEAAEAAKSEAEAAQTAAETAQDKAEAAADAAKENNVAAAQEAAKAASEAVKAATESGKAASEAAKAAKSASEAVASASAAAKSAEESAGYASNAAKSASDAQVAQKAAEDAKAAAEAAQKAAEAEKKAAEEAKGDAEAAQAAAEAAQAAADAAQAAAEAEKLAAEAAKKAAEDAQSAAEAAQKAAEEDQLNAEAAEEAAAAAQAAAEAAQKAAEAEKLAAEEAQKAAEDAEVAAEAAQKAAEEERLAAEAAKIAAEEERKAAEEAKAAAEAAQKAAEEAALNGAKYQAALNLDTYAQKVDQTGYDAEQIEAVATIVSDAKAAIADAESIDEVQELLDEAKATVDAVEDLCSSNAYTDVAKDAWYHEYVDFMVENGYMNGVSDTLFDVNGSVTRAQLVTILYRTAGEPSVEGMDNPFTDVADGKWYTNAIIWAADEGIVKGVTETEFAPDAKITRQQIVTILYRYGGEQKVDEDKLGVYSDAQTVSAYAMDAMNWAIANGIVNGMTETTLAPVETATRAQICAIVMRYLEN